MKLMFSMFGEDIGLLPQKLFSRILLGSKNDPAKRSQIGAHYTSREDILTLLEPVVMARLRRDQQSRPIRSH